jgi:hypothetical protein
MTRSQQQKMRRLELENEQLRDMHNKHLEVYRDQLIEIIELKATLELMQEALNGRSYS